MKSNVTKRSFAASYCFIIFFSFTVFTLCRFSKAADVELILGTSSAFHVVTGTAATANVGTTTLYVGSSTAGIGLVGIGTTTPASTLYIVGSSTASGDSSLAVVSPSGTHTLYVRNDGVVVVGTSTLPSNAAPTLHVNGTFTVGSNGNSYFEVDETGSVTAYGTMTLSSGSLVLTDGTITVGTDKFVVWNTGSVTAAGTVTAANFSTPGTITVGSIPMSENPTGTLTVTGNMYVTGQLAAGTKLFLIPHPDPLKNGWMLQHSTVESPTRGDNLYRYRVNIENDKAVVYIPLPSYWKHLNENPQVWVTAAGQFANGYGYIDDQSNKLVIKGEKKGTYNVLLVGTRKDPFARKFDAKGVEFKDQKRYELLTSGMEQDKDIVQLINTNNDTESKKFIDPIAGEFGWAACQ